MKITHVEVRQRKRPPSTAPIKDALQTLSGGGQVEISIRTDDGLSGDSSTHFGRIDGAPNVLAALVREELAPVLLGRDATRISELVSDLKREVEYHGYGGYSRFAISAIDTALWDLLGKAHSMPCYQLWGAYRDRLPAYAMVGWLNFNLGELRRNCRTAVEQGFRGVKIKVGAPSIDDDIRRIEAVRAEIGSDITLMVDANQSLTFSEALRRGHAFQELGIEWFEEPIAAHDLEGYAELTRALRIPVATGENLYGSDECLPFFTRRACRIIQPDLRRAGGPTEVRRIGELAGAFGVPYASHGGGPAALSLLLSAPTAIWLETGLRQGQDDYPKLEDGFALAPTGAGLEWE